MKKPMEKIAAFTREKSQILLLSFFSLFNLFLVLTRIQISGYITFSFLIWNLFLAWIPYWASSALIKYCQKRNCQKRNSWPIVITLLGIWLAFLPNAPYILTDLIHLKPRPGISVFYDLLMLTSFGINGLLLALISLTDVHDVLAKVVPQRLANFAVSIILFLTSYGIYLGRVLRWNSWDLLLNPHLILDSVIAQLTCSSLMSAAGYMTFMFFGFLSLNYFSFRLLKQRR